MAVELASGYVSIVAETSGVAKGIRNSLKGVDKIGDSAGRSLGSKISSGIGKTLKVGAAAAGVAAGGVLATSITKGLGRLTAIDSAEAKLAGLGHTTESTAAVMDSALESVSGTAFGLGDAATIAAGAVAAGIEPGKELTKYLSMTADAAAIAGTDLSEMGSILNQVQTSQEVYSDNLNQLADRGIPIYTWLAEEAGVAQSEVKALASEGAISSEMFFNAIQNNIGGAAQKIGELSIAAAFDNLGAAAGRFGATLTGPAFSAAPAIISALTSSFDAVNDAIGPAAERIGELLTPALETVADLIETRVTPMLADGAEKVGEFAVKITEAAVDPATWERIGGVFSSIGDTVSLLWPSIESLAGSFSRVVGSISVATWEALGAVLEALTPLIESVLVPLVEKVADFAEQNPGAVEAMVIAFLGFKGVSAISGPVSAAAGAIGSLGGAFSTARTLIGAGGVVDGVKELGKYSKDSNPILASMGGVVEGLGKSAKGAGKLFSPLLKVLGTVIRFINPWVAVATIAVGVLTWFFRETEIGQAIWDGFTTALADGWDWVVEKLSAGWDWIRENVFTPLMDFLTGTVQPLWDQVWGGIQEAWDVFTSSLQSAWENIIKPVFDAIWRVVQVTLGVIGTLILAPLMIAWNLWSSAIQWAWENVIQPVWSAISTFATETLWPMLQSAFEWIGEKWDQMGAILEAGWQWIKINVFEAFISAVQDFWNSYISPIFTWIGDKWNQLRDVFQLAWDWIKVNVIDAFSTALTNFWNSYVSPILTWVQDKWDQLRAALGTAWDWIKINVIQAFQDGLTNFWNSYVSPILTWVSDKWDDMGNLLKAGWDWIDRNVLSAFRAGLEGFQSFFDDIVSGISRVWDSLRGALAKPINFMINTVYNDGILKAWNIIAGILPGLNEGSPLSGIPEHATGGRISGPGTGTSDDVLMWGSNGEHMLTAREVQRAGGHAHVYAMREMLRFGRPFSYDGRGGLLALPRDPSNRAGDLLGAAPDLIPAFRDGGEIRPMWEMQLQAGHEFAKAQHGKPYQWGGPGGPGQSFDCSGYMASIAAAIQGGNPWQRYWATMAFSGGGNSQHPSGPQGFVAGLGPGFSIGIWNGGAYGGHTAGTLGAAGPYGTVNVESGGSPSMVKYGVGAVGADHAQFTTHYHLPIGADGAFVSGGEGGMDPGVMRAAVSEALNGAIDTILSPILGLLPEKPPEWQGIPRGYYEKGRDGLTGAVGAGVENLTDGLATVWTAITSIPDLVREALGGGDDVNDAARATLFDSGGVWRSGTVGVNLSGADEYVFTNQAMRSFAGATESLQVVAKELSVAFHGGDWGYGELAHVLGNEEWAKAIVDGSATLGKISREVGAALVPEARQIGEDYLAEQASDVLDVVGLGGLVGIGRKVGATMWDAYQAAPVEVGFNGQSVVVEIEAESDDDLVRVRQLREMADRVHGLEVRVNRKPPAATATRGGVM